ncbi:MAG: hypothetical protein R3C18_13820 [Planctomycetaceae bacterium]
MSRTAWIVSFVLLGIFALAVFIGINAAWGIDDAYAQVGAVSMVRHYMDDHNGQWPNGWEDLRPYFESGGGEVAGWSFEEYQRRIYIDFDADAEALRRSALTTDSPEFNVIHARWTVIAFGDGPNADLHNRFRRDAKVVAALPPTGEGRVHDENESPRQVRCTFSEGEHVFVVSSGNPPTISRLARAEEGVWHLDWKESLPAKAPRNITEMMGTPWKEGFVLVVKGEKWSWWAFESDEKFWTYGLIDVPADYKCVDLKAGEHGMPGKVVPGVMKVGLGNLRCVVGVRP